MRARVGWVTNGVVVVQPPYGVTIAGAVPVVATVDVGGVVVRARVRALDASNLAPAGVQTRGCQAGAASSGSLEGIDHADTTEVGKVGFFYAVPFATAITAEYRIRLYHAKRKRLLYHTCRRDCRTQTSPPPPLRVSPGSLGDVTCISTDLSSLGN